jgi:alpha-1,2-mannosyltransferase
MFFINYWKSLSPLTRNMAFFALLNIIGINLCLRVLSPGAYTETVFTHIIHSFLLRETGQDSWDPMIVAFRYIQSAHDTTVYSEIFFNNKVKFQYPLSSLFPFVLLDWTIPKNEWRHTLKLTTYIAIVLNVLFTTKIFNLVLIKTSAKANLPSSKVDALTRNLIIICLSFTFYPVVKAFQLGQIQVWLNSLFALVTWLWLKKFERLAGTATAIMTLIKPQYLIICVWSFMRKRYQFFLFFSIIFITGLLTSVLAFGYENNFDYLNVLSFISKHGESFKNNHSVNGLANRLIFNGENLQWEAKAFPPFNPIVYISTLVSSLILISLALIPISPKRSEGGIVDFLIIALSSVMASPIAWEHHYGILLPIYAVLLPLSLMESTFSRANIILLALTYVFSSNYFKITDMLANIPILNIFQSYLFIAAFVLLLYLYRLRYLLISRSKSIDYQTVRDDLA